ncbi:MAG: hypothetical protein RIM72_06470 [Alphaproteobacteria bacterium]
MQLTRMAFILIALLTPSLAYAYTGPGLGLGAIVAVLAIVFSSILAVLAIFWYPIKRLFKKRGAKPETEHSQKSGPDSPNE